MKFDPFHDSQATTAELSRDIRSRHKTKLERGGNFHTKTFFHDLYSKFLPLTMVSLYFLHLNSVLAVKLNPKSSIFRVFSDFNSGKMPTSTLFSKIKMKEKWAKSKMKTDEKKECIYFTTVNLSLERYVFILYPVVLTRYLPLFTVFLTFDR